ncbi:MAG: ribose 5-phosphate isomerase B [Opitutales bacterium]
MPSAPKTIALGTDHAGFLYKEAVKAWLERQGYTVLDFGAHSPESSDYPDFVRPAAEAVAAGKADGGVVFGGSGNGEAIVANKVPGIRCGVCWNPWTAEMTKAHNDANMISLGARTVGEAEAIQLVKTWLETEFEGGRHARRVGKIEPERPTKSAT